MISILKIKVDQYPYFARNYRCVYKLFLLTIIYFHFLHITK